MRILYTAVQRLIVLSLIFSLVVNPSWAKTRTAEIQKVEIHEEGNAEVVHIFGVDLQDCQPVLTRDPKGVALPRMSLTFENTRVSARALGTFAGLSSVRSIRVSEITLKPHPIAQVILDLTADVKCRVRRSDGILVEVEKKSAAEKSEIPQASNPETPEQDIPRDYTLLPRDEIFISVSPAEELSRSTAVDENGRISIPLVGAIQVTGMTTDQLSKKIVSMLGHYVANPKVDVFLRQSRMKQIWITGQINTPGSYAYRMNMRLLDLISQAGGLSLNANKRLIRVMRGKGSERRVLPVDLVEIISSGDVSKDFVLEPGDIVEIGRGSNGVTIFGSVSRPGSFDYVYNMHLLDLVSLCQGFKDGANLRKIQVIRGEAPNQTITNIRFTDIMHNKKNSNIALKPGDIIFVPEKPLWSASAYANIFTPFTALVLAGATIALVMK